jgi:hypothetical protein
MSRASVMQTVIRVFVWTVRQARWPAWPGPSATQRPSGDAQPSGGPDSSHTWPHYQDFVSRRSATCTQSAVVPLHSLRVGQNRSTFKERSAPIFGWQHACYGPASAAGGVSTDKLAVCLATICHSSFRFIQTFVTHNWRLISIPSKVASAAMR